MCLILVAWRVHEDYPWVLAANRDEFHERPTREADWWEGEPGLLAGRDGLAGGTWLGVTRSGRFAALTNFRGGSPVRADAPSRGALVPGFLRSGDGTADALACLAAEGANCNPYNVLCSDGLELGVHESTTGETRLLGPGIYALSNHLLDTPWPKVRQAKSALAEALGGLPRNAPLLDLLRDTETAPDEELPRTGASLELERMLSSAFVKGESYGTRCSTVVTCTRDGEVAFSEWSWTPDGELAGLARFHFTIGVDGRSEDNH